MLMRHEEGAEAEEGGKSPPPPFRSLLLIGRQARSSGRDLDWRLSGAAAASLYSNTGGGATVRAQ